MQYWSINIDNFTSLKKYLRNDEVISCKYSNFGIYISPFNPLIIKSRSSGIFK